MNNKPTSTLTFPEAVARLINNARPGSYLVSVDGYDYVLDDHYPALWYKVSKRGTSPHDIVGKGLTNKGMIKKLLTELSTGEDIAFNLRYRSVLWVEGGRNPNIMNDRTRKTIYYKWK